MCVWEGNAFLFFTLTIDGVPHSVSLETFDKHETTVEDYVLHLGDISPNCPRGNPENYTLEIALYPTDTEPVLFLEKLTIKDGTTLSGVCPLLCIDFPSYSYNRESGILNAMQILYITDSTRVILGSGLNLNGDAGCGISSELFLLDTVPNTYFDSFSYDDNGTVHITHKGEEITLAPGEVWEKNSSYEETSEDCRILISEKNRISNFGFLMPYQISAPSFYSLY